jgi:hypothetical protein
MLVASDRELVSAFGWPLATARAALDELVDRGEAVLEADAYRPARITCSYVVAVISGAGVKADARRCACDLPFCPSLVAILCVLPRPRRAW